MEPLGSLSTPGARSGVIPWKGGKMRKYEVTFIVHPDLDETAFNEVQDRVKNWISDAGGKVTNVDLWGKKKLAYEIRKQTEGQYVLFETEMPPSFCAELERNMQLQESIMRYLVTRPTETTPET
jgi:small subunit ribosomal protein S6